MLKKSFLITLILTTYIACTTNDDTPGGGSSDQFDRSAMLANMADNIILPAYLDLETKLKGLVTAKNDFIASPTSEALSNFRTSWLESYKTWQYVEMFNIGEAEILQYHFQMNIYPTNVVDIQNNINSGSYDLTIPNNHDAVGFPAIDYLLYGLETVDKALLNKYTVNTDATKYKAYLSDLVDQMLLLTQKVRASWTNGYRDTFVNSTQNTASSSVNQFVNDYIFYYEKGLRANKFGIPAGIFSRNPLPEKVEGFFSQEISKELALNAIDAVQNVFNGKHYKSLDTGVGFSEYLEQLNKKDLATRINDQFDAAKEKIEILDNNLYNQIKEDNTKMTQSYDALQVGVVLLKVDMLQAFNISLDFVDADGD